MACLGAQPLGGQGSMAPPLHFPNQTRSNSFSFKHQGCCFLRVFRNYTDQKLHDFCRVCYIFQTIYGNLSFFLTTQGKQITSHWTFRKGPIINPGPIEKFLIVDHPKEDHKEREFQRQVIGGIRDLLKKSSKTRETSI